MNAQITIELNSCTSSEPDFIWGRGVRERKEMMMMTMIKKNRIGEGLQERSKNEMKLNNNLKS